MNLSPVLLFAAALVAILAVVRPDEMSALLRRLAAAVRAGLESIRRHVRDARVSFAGRVAGASLTPGGSYPGAPSPGTSGWMHCAVVGTFLAVAGAGVLGGDAAIGIESVCGLVRSECATLRGVFDVGEMFFLALIGATVFWGMLAAETLKFTRAAPWWTEHTGRGSRRLTAGAVSVTMMIFGVVVLVALARYREIVSSVVIGDQASLASVLADTKDVRGLVLVGGGLLIALTGPLAFVAVGFWAEGVIGALLLGAGTAILGVVGAALGAVAWASTLLIAEIPCALIGMVPRRRRDPALDTEAGRDAGLNTAPGMNGHPVDPVDWNGESEPRIHV